MTTAPARIVSFHDAVEPQSSTPEPDRLLSGAPQLTVWNHYADASNQFFAGVWASTRGKWRVRYSEHEFCHITRGRVRIASTSGEQWDFAAGDSFVVPAGFAGTWEVIEECRKLYAIFEAHAPT